MPDRTLPEPERFASCPDDGNILDYYKGQFEAVYIILHPFLKSDIDWKGRFAVNDYPSKQEKIEKCTPVIWKKITELTPLHNIREVDIALRTYIGGLNEKYRNSAFANHLEKLFSETTIIEPEKGNLPPLLENRIYDVIKKLGFEWLWVGNEFGDERKLHYIDDLISSDLIPHSGCIFTHDHTILVTTHWDSHCSFLCSSKRTIDKILAVDLFEGFYCANDTQVCWGVDIQ